MSLPNPSNQRRDLVHRFLPIRPASPTYFAVLCHSCNHDRTLDILAVHHASQPDEEQDLVIYDVEAPCSECGHTWCVVIEVPSEVM